MKKKGGSTSGSDRSKPGPASSKPGYVITQKEAAKDDSSKNKEMPSTGSKERGKEAYTASNDWKEVRLGNRKPVSSPAEDNQGCEQNESPTLISSGEEIVESQKEGRTKSRPRRRRRRRE